MIYIASPYSHPDSRIRWRRYRQVRAHVATLIARGLFPYSPVVHNHHVANHHELPVTFAFWEEFDLHMLSLADSLHVYELDGWQTSSGVAEEMRWWELNRPGRAIVHTGPL